MARLANLFEQGDVLAALGRTVLSSALPALKGGAPFIVPGPEYHAVVRPRSNELVNDYIKTVGGSVSAYRATVPFHMFPQWGFPLGGKTVASVPWNLAGIMNAGFEAEIHGEIPRNEELLLSARLVDADITDKRALLYTRLTTSTKSKGELLRVIQTAIVKIPPGGKKLRGSHNGSSRREKPFIPEQAREIGRVRLGADAGLQYSLVSGDVNPLHWLKPYARAFGQRGQILHGFASSAMALEIMNKQMFSGRVDRLSRVIFRFTRPVNLPGGFKVFVHDNNIYAGNAPGGESCLEGSFLTKENV